MKLSELKPCASCHKPLMQAPAIRPFYVLRMSMAMIDAAKANRVLGLMHAMGGGMPGFPIAEAMSPDSDCVLVTGDQEPSLLSILFICQDCYLSADICLARAAESSGS